MLQLNECQALVLNADFIPLQYYPSLLTWNWQEATKAVLGQSVVVVSEYDTIIRSPSLEMFAPSVIALKHYRPQPRIPTFNRYNLWVRDRFRCQYCNERLPGSELTYDHVLPVSRGGANDFHNVVACCQGCNSRKRNRTPEEAGMKLLKPPKVPTFEELARWVAANRQRQRLHPTWREFVPDFKGRGNESEIKGLSEAGSGGVLDWIDEPVTKSAFPEDMTSEDYWQVPLLKG